MSSSSDEENVKISEQTCKYPYIKRGTTLLF